jgi:phage repressor protein C with HTH and peptisase S24 domain
VHSPQIAMPGFPVYCFTVPECAYIIATLIANGGAMDTAWFMTALERAGLSQADLARHLRLAPSAVSRMLKGDRQMKLLEAAQTAAFLGVSQDVVLRRAAGEGPPVAQPEGPRRRGRPPLATTQMRAMTGTEPIPIRSAAREGAGHEMILEDGPTGYTPRPSNLNGVRGAYAIYMTGDAMEPRYQQGWLLHIHPYKPPIRGRDVVVYKRDKAVLIRQFAGWDGDTLVLCQLNPAKDLKIPRTDVGECHLIVGVDQEG